MTQRVQRASNFGRGFGLKQRGGNNASGSSGDAEADSDRANWTTRHRLMWKETEIRRIDRKPLKSTLKKAKAWTNMAVGGISPARRRRLTAACFSACLSVVTQIQLWDLSLVLLADLGGNVHCRTSNRKQSACVSRLNSQTAAGRQNHQTWDRPVCLSGSKLLPSSHIRPVQIQSVTFLYFNSVLQLNSQLRSLCWKQLLHSQRICVPKQQAKMLSHVGRAFPTTNLTHLLVHSLL